MKTAILVTARLGSNRLPRKHLLPIGDKKILSFLLSRIYVEFESECKRDEADIIICTSDLPENKDLECLCDDRIEIFYGANDNIPYRHLKAAEAFDSQYIISVDGDDILCSTSGMRMVYQALYEGKTYVRTVNFPLGMNSCGYRRDFLEKSLVNKANKVIEIDWPRIFDETKLSLIQVEFPLMHDLLRLTLDYQQDYELFKKIIENFGDSIYSATDMEIVGFVIENELYKMTEPILKEYWRNYNLLEVQEKLKNN